MVSPRHPVAVLLWRALAIAFLVLALVGVALPLLPTVPFLLLAAAAASRGWPRLEDDLLGHPVYGPPIRRWRERGAVPRRAKWLASAGMAASAVMVVLSPAPHWVRWTVPAMLMGVATWLWSRPED